MTSSKTKILHLFRHGQTDWNLANKLQGHTDIPLNAEGERQSRALQKYFAENPVSLFISSDLKRAQQTAHWANFQLQKPLHTHAGLRESYLGDIEGRTKDEVFALYGEEHWQRWNSLVPEHADFRYPQAESARETVTRSLATLKQFCQEQDFNAAGVCTHGLVLRRLLHFINPGMKKPLPVPNCSVYQLEYDLTTEQFHFHFNE